MDHRRSTSSDASVRRNETDDRAREDEEGTSTFAFHPDTMRGSGSGSSHMESRDQQHLTMAIRQLREELASFTSPNPSLQGGHLSSTHPGSSSSFLVDSSVACPSSAPPLSSWIDVEVRLVLLLCQSPPYRWEDWEEARERAEVLWERLQPSSYFGSTLPPPSRVGVQMKLASSLRRACLQRGDLEAGERWTQRFQGGLHWRSNLEEMTQESGNREAVGEEEPPQDEEEGEERWRRREDGHRDVPSASPSMWERGPRRENEGNFHRAGGGRYEDGDSVENRRETRGGEEEERGFRDFHSSFSSPDSRSFGDAGAVSRTSHAASSGWTAREERREGSGYGGEAPRAGRFQYTGHTKHDRTKGGASSKQAAARPPSAMQSFKKSLWLEHPQLRWGKLKGGPTPGPRYTG